MTPFTLVHVVISLAGIGAGLVMAFGLLAGNSLDGWTAFFLVTTLLTSVTGFFFPFHGFKPSYVVGVLSLIVITLAILGRYRHQLIGAWRSTYVVSAMLALYLNVFVLIVQLFLKVPAIHALAPTGSEPPFKIAQLLTLILFIVWTAAAVRQFRRAYI